MSTHLAARFHNFGGLDELRIETVPTPAPGDNDVLVRVGAAGVNHLDLDMLAGTSGYDVPLPHTLGLSAAGVVEAVGANVDDQVQSGDRVVVSSDIVCGECSYCRSGRDNLCPYAIRPGWTHPGAFAELMLAPVRGVHRLPDSISLEAAAVSNVGYGTGWHMLVTRAKVAANEWVLINGAAGTIGIGAVQIAALAGARVIAATGSREKARRLRADGASATVDYGQPDFVAEVLSITGGEGVDVVFECVGGSVFERSLQCLREGGRLVTCGAHAGETVSLDVISLFRRELTLIGCNAACQAEIAEVLDLMARGRLAPRIAARFELQDLAKAFAFMRERRHYGSIVVCPGGVAEAETTWTGVEQ
jgi:NADPH:quinone reductase-like Zn-dependent oxidoreductase